VLAIEANAGRCVARSRAIADCLVAIRRILPVAERGIVQSAREKRLDMDSLVSQYFADYVKIADS
jgi:hypothetical protein